jgi:hypothetical protein
VIVEEYSRDDKILRSLLELEKQAAMARGKWERKRDAAPVVTDEREHSIEDLMRMANFTPERMAELRSAYAAGTAGAKGETTT